MHFLSSVHAKREVDMGNPRLLVGILFIAFGPATFAATGDTSDPTGLGQVLSVLTGALAAYVAVLAGTSGLTVALLEAFKKLFSIRGRFHRTAVIRWLSQDAASVP